MAERIVVSCRMNGEEASRPGSRYLERARTLTQRAEALGATLASWSATTLAFSFDVESLDEAIDLAGEAVKGDAGSAPTARWASAIARGEMEPLADKGGGRADLAWGDALVAAVVLARAAWPGEVLVEATFPDVDALVTTGKRAGRDGERRVRGVRIDPRQPWKKDAAASVTRLVTPAFAPRVDFRALLARPGVVHVVRADPGQGGTRMLAEIARAVAPGPVLLVTPSGASVEPLGALRRALVRILATRPYPSEPDLAQPLDLLLAGVGASIEQAAAIIAAMLRPAAPGEPPGALLLDDASEIDAESLEACAQVVATASLREAQLGLHQEMASPFHVVVRIDATDQVPTALGPLPRGKELELGPMDRAEGESLAKAATKGALDTPAAHRIARRAAQVPLAVLEALALALGRGDVAWIEDAAGLRARASFAGKPAKAAYWIGKRAKQTTPDEKGVLAAIALLGGEALRPIVKETLAHVDAAIDVDAAIASLVGKRWLVEPQNAWVALPSRTHRDTIAELLDETPRRALHHAITDVLEASEGEIACAEAAHHAVMSGEGERGARLALRAARAAAAAGMSKSANRLLTLARLADPKCEPLTRQQLLTSLPPPVPPSSLPPSRAHFGSRVPRPVTQPPLPSPYSSAPVVTGAASPPSMQPAPSEPSMMPSHAPLEALPSPAPPPPPAPPRPVPVVRDDEPTQRVNVLNAAQAAGLLEAFEDNETEHDSDYPTVMKMNPALDRPTEPDPIPAYVRIPPPNLRPSRQMPAVAPRPPEPPPARALPPEDATLPRPLAPPPLRPSREMSAVRPNDPTAPRLAPPPPRPPSPPSPPSSGVSPVPTVRRASTLGMPGVAPRPAAKPASLAPPAALPVAPVPPASAPAAPAPTLSADASAMATRMVDLAKSALLQGDAAAVDRWTEGLRAAGDHDRVAERIEAIARLSRGEVGEALRSLRTLRAGASESPPSSRAQASLALGVALAAANRPEEALLVGLEALARAREGADPRAAGACLAFLAKLYVREERSEAASLRAAAIG